MDIVELSNRVLSLEEDMRATRREISFGFDDIRALIMSSKQPTPQGRTANSTPTSGRSPGIPDITKVFDEEKLARDLRQDLGREPERRLSSFENLTQDKAFPTPTVVIDRPKFLGKRLENLAVAEVLEFCDAVRAFEAEHGLNLPVGTLFSEEARTRLIAKSEGRLQQSIFYSYPLSKLFGELQIALRPLSPEAFRQVIRDNVKFPLPATWTPTRSNGDQFFDALLSYAERFSFVFTFLASGNAKNTPSLDARDGGVLKLFASKIPYSYGTRTLERISRKFGTLQDFIDEFLAQCTSTRDCALAANNELLRFDLSQAAKVAPVSQPQSPSKAEILVMQKGGRDANESSTLGCHSMILNHRCSTAKCKFSHATADLRDAWSALYKKLMASEYARSFRGAKLNFMEAYGDMDICCATFDADSSDNIPTIPVRAKWIGELSDIVVNGKLLLDLGTSKNNYVSPDFLDFLSSSWSSSTHQGQQVVQMLNGNLVVCSEFVDLRIYPADRTESFDLHFWILHGLSVDLLVGFVDSVGDFGDIFVEHLKSTVTAAKRKTG